MHSRESVLKKDNNNSESATFLDLDISINEGQFVTKLYDKGDNFSFSIVRLHHKISNSPSKTFYSTIATEITRMCKATTLFNDFVIAVKALINRMHFQGAVKGSLICVCMEMLNRHGLLFQKYSIRNRVILDIILE